MIHIFALDYGNEFIRDFIMDCQTLTSEHLKIIGFTCGYTDLLPPSNLKEIVEPVLNFCHNKILGIKTLFS